MVEINLPFLQRFAPKLLDGVKVMTARTRPYGKEGDRFKAFGGTFELVANPEKMLLANVALNWKLEGCSSPQEFIDIWNAIHPVRRYDPFQIVYAHFFRRIDIPVVRVRFIRPRIT